MFNFKKLLITRVDFSFFFDIPEIFFYIGTNFQLKTIWFKSRSVADLCIFKYCIEKYSSQNKQENDNKNLCNYCWINSIITLIKQRWNLLFSGYSPSLQFEIFTINTVE